MKAEVPDATTRLGVTRAPEQGGGGRRPTKRGAEEPGPLWGPGHEGLHRRRAVLSLVPLPAAQRWHCGPWVVGDVDGVQPWA